LKYALAEADRKYKELEKLAKPQILKKQTAAK